MGTLSKLVNVTAWPSYARLASPAGWRRIQADHRIRRGDHIAEVRINSLKLLVDLRDEIGIGRRLYVERCYEHDETMFLSRVVKPGMVFVDVGANIGYFTTLAARLVGDRGRVVAFEPDVENYLLLRRNIDGNGLDTVVAINKALGASPGTALLYRSPVNFGDHRLNHDGHSDREAILVHVDSLDASLAELETGPVDVIKMDVQGYECQVLEGMRQTLADSPSITVLAECWPYGLSIAGDSIDKFLEFFRQLGFSVFHLNEGGEDIPVEWSDVPGLIPTNVSSPGSAYVNLVFRRPKSRQMAGQGLTNQ